METAKGIRGVPKMETRPVEFGRLWNNHTWNTVTLQCPTDLVEMALEDEPPNEGPLLRFGQDRLAHEDLAMVIVYNIDP